MRTGGWTYVQGKDQKNINNLSKILMKPTSGKPEDARSGKGYRMPSAPTGLSLPEAFPHNTTTSLHFLFGATQE